MILDIYENCNADTGCHDRWQRWEQHRQNINAILKEKVFSVDLKEKELPINLKDKELPKGLLKKLEENNSITAKLEDAIVLGAGRCEDIDLKFLLKHIETLTLVDYDYTSMEKAVERQQLDSTEKKRIILKGNIEFTGFYSDHTISEIIQKIKSGETPEKVVAYAMECLESANVDFNDLLKLDNHKYSLVISGAVHSQLIIPYTKLSELDSATELDIDSSSKLDFPRAYYHEMMGKVSEVADKLAENYNKSLLSLLNEQGWLFSYFDVMELVGEEARSVAGARHGYEHLCELGENRKLYSEPYETSWIWHFRDNKKYYICSLCFRKHKSVLL